jgi:predicted GTPase
VAADRPSFWRRWWVAVIAALLLAVPVLTVLVSGVVWLLERDWFLWWFGAAALGTVIAWLALRARHSPFRESADVVPDALTEPDANWSPHEQAAWEEVRRLSAEADVAMLADRRKLLAAAEQTIEAVARHYYPGRKDPALEFTLPELLLLTERVSSRLRLLLLEQVPYSHRLKAGYLLRAWGYRPVLAKVFQHGRKVYGVLRVVRAISPLGALAAEVRDYVVNDLYQNLQTHVRMKLVRMWVEEVGRAAIELYSGRLRVDTAGLAALAAAETLEGAAAEAPLPGALRLLVAGRSNAGKSTLVNDLLGSLEAGVDVLPATAAFEGYELRREGEPDVWLIDSPGVEDESGQAELARRAFACDLILWVAAAHRPDRQVDRGALDRLRERFAAEPRRKMPPVIVVASHIDRLPPVREWSPPYNVAEPASAKERSIRGALDAIAADLLVPVETIVPARLDGAEPYNLDVLELRLAEQFGEAHRTRWIRIQRDAADHRDWRRAWRQLAGAGRMVGELVKRSARTGPRPETGTESETRTGTGTGTESETETERLRSAETEQEAGKKDGGKAADGDGGKAADRDARKAADRDAGKAADRDAGDD